MAKQRLQNRDTKIDKVIHLMSCALNDTDKAETEAAVKAISGLNREEINIPDSFGTTILGCAAYLGSKAMIKAAREAGANVEQSFMCGGEEHTPLGILADHKQFPDSEVMWTLLKGEQPNIINITPNNGDINFVGMTGKFEQLALLGCDQPNVISDDCSSTTSSVILDSTM